MSGTFDLYAELGVARDAAEAALKKAYRKRSKETHPDTAAGSEEAFRRVKTAYDVLSDPEKRTKYDNTGQFDDDTPDNLRAAALGVIEATVAAVVNPFFMGGMNPNDDPRQLDLVGAMRDKITQQIVEGRNGITMALGSIEALRDIGRRFEGKLADEFVRASFERQAAGHEKAVEDIRRSIRVREHALELLKECEFRRDSRQRPFGFYFPMIGVAS